MSIRDFVSQAAPYSDLLLQLGPALRPEDCPNCTWGSSPDPHRIPERLRRAVFLRDRGLCQLCPRRVNPFTRGQPDSYECDHWPMPHSCGGPTTLSNLRVLCRKCNQKLSNQACWPCGVGPVPDWLIMLLRLQIWYRRYAGVINLAITAAFALVWAYNNIPWFRQRVDRAWQFVKQHEPRTWRLPKTRVPRLRPPRVVFSVAWRPDGAAAA